MNFAPVVDVNNKPNNPIISMRSFGENRYKVTERAYQIMRGMHDGDILTSLKHFPGHGDTDLDSHLTLPTIPHDRARLDEIELFPFRELINRGATGVMTAHLLVPELCDENIPVSQSRAVVHDLLVEELGFQGLIVTDALEMVGALVGRDQDRVALYSLLAGNHILEIPIDVRASITVIEQAVENGEVELKFVQNAVRKVLGAKFDLGLYRGFEPINPDGILARLNTPEAYDLRMRLAEHSLTLLANKEHILPLNVSENLRNVRHIEIGQGNAFKYKLQKMTGIETISLMPDFTPAQFNTITHDLRNIETIIISYHHTPGRLSFASFGVSESVVNFVQNLAKNHNVILVFFGNPYAIASFTHPELFAGLIAAYDNSPEAQISSARAIFGQIPFLGKLPITINKLFAEDFGIIMSAREPERVMMVP
jgi:beta-glucosidase-like glycosyl hydrolase